MYIIYLPSICTGIFNSNSEDYGLKIRQFKSRPGDKPKEKQQSINNATIQS